MVEIWTPLTLLTSASGVWNWHSRRCSWWLENSSSGYGAGAGKLSVNGTVGGGAGYGSKGQHHSTDVTYGGIYGSTPLSHLHGGSGGGAASATGGGAGGGAISLEADGNGTLTIVAGGVISANGGSVADLSSNGGGGGSGGSIRLSGKSITNNGTIRAKELLYPAEALVEVAGWHSITPLI